MSLRMQTCLVWLFIACLTTAQSGVNYNYLNSKLGAGVDSLFYANQGLCSALDCGGSDDGETIANLNFNVQSDYIVTDQNSGVDPPYYISITLNYHAYVREVMVVFPENYCNYPSVGGCYPNMKPLALTVGFEQDPSLNPICAWVKYNGFYSCNRSGYFVGLVTDYDYSLDPSDPFYLPNDYIELVELLVFEWEPWGWLQPFLHNPQDFELINGDIDSIWQKQEGDHILQRSPNDDLWQSDDVVQWDVKAIKDFQLDFRMVEEYDPTITVSRVVETVFVVFAQTDDLTVLAGGTNFELWVTDSASEMFISQCDVKHPNDMLYSATEFYHPTGVLFDCNGQIGDTVTLLRTRNMAPGLVISVTAVRIYTTTSKCDDYTTATGGIDFEPLIDQTTDLIVCWHQDIDVFPYAMDPNYQDCNVATLITADEHSDTFLPVEVSPRNAHLFSYTEFSWDEGIHNLYIRGYGTQDIQEISVSVQYLYEYNEQDYLPVANATFLVDPCCINYAVAEFEIQNKTLVVGEVGEMLLPNLTYDNTNTYCSYQVQYALLDEYLFQVDPEVQVNFTTVGAQTFLHTRVDDPTYANKTYELNVVWYYYAVRSDGTEDYVFEHFETFYSSVELGCDQDYALTSDAEIGILEVFVDGEEYVAAIPPVSSNVTDGCNFTLLVELFDASKPGDEVFDQDWILGFETVTGVRPWTEDPTDIMVFQSTDSSLIGLYAGKLKFSYVERPDVFLYLEMQMDVRKLCWQNSLQASSQVADQTITIGSLHTIQLPVVELSDVSCESVQEYSIITQDGLDLTQLLDDSYPPVMQYQAGDPSLAGKTVRLSMTVISSTFSEVEPYTQLFSVTFEAVELKFEPPLTSYHSVVANQTSLWLYTLPGLDASLQGKNVRVTVGVPQPLAGLVSWEQSGEAEGAFILIDTPTADSIGSYTISIILDELDLSLSKTFSMAFEVLSPEEAEQQQEQQAEAQAAQIAQEEAEKSFSSGIEFEQPLDVSTFSPSEQEQYEELLTAKIGKVTKKGELTMLFSHDMIIPSNYKELLNQYLTNDKNFIGVEGRQTQKVEEQPSLLTLDFVPSNSYREASDYQFGWKIIEYMPRQLTIQMVFQKAKYVSSYEVSKMKQFHISWFQSEDSVMIFMQPNRFFTDKFRRNFDEQFAFVHFIPAQIQLGSPEESIAAATDSVSSGAKATVVGNVILSFIL